MLKTYFSFLMFSMKEFFHTLSHYYLASWTFLKVDFLLYLAYIFENPYRVSKNFLLKKNEALVDVYGETPLSTLEKIAGIAKVSDKDIVIECGFGRGRAAFWLSIFKKCKVIGYEHIPFFVINANQVKKKAGITNVDFRLDSLEKADYSEASVIYLYGICLPDVAVSALVKKFKMLKGGTQVISVSYPLNDYDKDKSFEVMRAVECSFPWGSATVFFQRVK